MQIDSARELKAFFLESFDRPSDAVARAHAVSPHGDRRTAHYAGVPIALGIVPQENGQVLLAIRTQANTPYVRGKVAQIIAKARGEVDVRHIGLLQALPVSPAPRLRPRQLQIHRRPLSIGYSIGHFAVTAGTIGAFVQDRLTKRTAILSNNHVLANCNLAARFEPVIQPGFADGGSRGKDIVASLLSTLPLMPIGTNRVDAALAALNKDVDFEPSMISGLGRLSGIRSAPLVLGTPVAKLGRTTALTRGYISMVELDGVKVEYPGLGVLEFGGQVEITGTRGRFSNGGDSGSLIVDNDVKAVALLFAGNAKATYANPLPPVLDLLHAELIT